MYRVDKIKNLHFTQEHSAAGFIAFNLLKALVIAGIIEQKGLIHVGQRMYA